jgi:hypothetical protein
MMRFKDLLREIVGIPSSQEASQPMAGPAASPAATADALMAGLEQISNRYDLRLFPTEAARADVRADLGLMIEFNDLQIVQLDLFGSEQRRLARFRANFDAGSVSWTSQPEGPGPDPDQVATQRLTVLRRGGEVAYRERLRLCWGNKAMLSPSARGPSPLRPRPPETGLPSGVAAWRRLEMVRTGTRGFAFARDLLLPRARSVFVLEQDLPPGLPLGPGVVFWALVVPVRRGLQARCCLAACVPPDQGGSWRGLLGPRRARPARPPGALLPGGLRAARPGTAHLSCPLIAPLQPATALFSASGWDEHAGPVPAGPSL